MNQQDALDHEYTEGRCALAVMIAVMVCASLFAAMFNGSADAAAFELLLLTSFLALFGVSAASPVVTSLLGWRAGR